jgi:hypothetical protein
MNFVSCVRRGTIVNKSKQRTKPGTAGNGGFQGSMVGRIGNQDKRQERHEHKDRCGNPTAIIFACIPAGSFATPPAKPLVEDPALEGGLPVNPAVLAACTVASGEALPLD